MNRTGERARAKCFTLIELIVVLVILGILAVLAIPTFNAIRQRGTETVAQADATTIARHATDLWAFFQGNDGVPEQGVTCANTCTKDEIIVSAAKESGFSGSSTTSGLTSQGGKGDAVLTAGDDADTWELNKAANTDNATCALITFASQSFSVTDCP